MPWADYRCLGCQETMVRNHVFSAQLGAIASAPLCTVCETYMAPIPAIGRMDAGGGSAFQAFDVAREVVDYNPATGQVERFQRLERIDSVHKARAVEQDAERRARNGEGEPMRFRMLSTDPSNKDVGSFGSFTPEDTKLVKGGRVQVTRHGEDPPTSDLAAGVVEGGGSTPEGGV